MASENHISQYSPRQRELFIQKSTRVAASYLRVDLEDVPKLAGMKTVGT